MNLSFKHYYWRWLKNLLLVFVFMLLAMTVARAAFAFFFGDLKILLKDLETLKSAFILGLRYDLIPLAYINIIPFMILNLGYFLPGKFTIKGIRFLLITTLVLGYIALAWLYIFDYGFYSFYQDHLNILIFGFLEDDTQAIVVSIWKNYNLPLWLTVVFLVHYAFWRSLKFFFSPYDFDLKAKKFDFRMPLAFIAGMVFLAWSARGSFSRLPLSVEDSHISSNVFINKLALNGVLTLNRAIKIRKTYGRDQFDFLKQYGYSDWRQAFKDAFGYEPKNQDLVKNLITRTPKNEKIALNPPHVVLVVMESFGSYWNKHDNENFQILGELKKHMESGIHYKNFLSAENGTIGSIVSVATAEVPRPGARYLSESEYMNTPLSSAGQLPYKKAGYDTHFVYGGKLGWRDLGKYLSTQGYDHLWGAEEIREAMPELNNFEEKELGNEWGIFDEYLYTFIEEHLRTATRPQFFLVLTTSNHPPFEHPSSYHPLKLELTREIMESITVDEDLARKRFVGLQYANQKTGEFISRIKGSSLRDKVVFALTGDHSYWITKGVGNDQEFKRYAVPFIISLPEQLRPAKIDQEAFGSHEDIFPTLYHLTLSNQEYVRFGENMLEGNSHAMNGSGLVANKTGAYHNGKFWLWKDLSEQLLVQDETSDALLPLKKHAQGLIGITDFYLKEEKVRKQTDAENDQP